MDKKTEINFDALKEGVSLELLARQLVEGFITGIHKSPHHGFSVEFAEHRLYNEGESVRHIDWRIFARTDRLYTKRYEEETNLRCMLVLDVSSSMYYPDGPRSKIRFGIAAAAAIAHLLQRQRDAVGLCLFSDHIETLTPIKSTSSHLRNLWLLLEKKALEERSLHKTTNAPKALHEVAQKTHRRSLIVIFSDLFDQRPTPALFSALQRLKHNQHEVLIFHISDHATELNFDFEERPYEFIDMETQRKVTLSPASVRKNFMAQSERLRRTLRSKCDQLKIDLVEAHVGDPYFNTLQAYLIKRAKAARKRF